MAQAEDLAQRPRQRIRPAEPYLENLFGEARPPTFIRTKNGEGLSAPPGLQKVRFGEEVQLRPYKTADGNHGKYLWVVDKEGNLLVAPESPAGASRVTKHTDVTQRGAGRVGGEFIYSEATDSWAINIDSGRYSATYTSEARAAAQAFGMSLQDTVEKLERKMPGLLITDRQNVHADNVVRNFRFGNEVITLTE